MATIASTTNATPVSYPSQTRMDRDPRTGYLYFIVKASTADTYDVYRSTNGGTSWGSYISIVRANVTDVGAIFINKLGALRWVYRTNESSQDRIYIRGLGLSSSPSWEAELRLANPSNGGVAGSVYTGLDVIEVDGSNGNEYFCVAVGVTVGGSIGVTLLGAYTLPGNLSVADNTVIHGTRQWISTGSGRVTPSLDIQHNGDGKSSNSPHLWLAFGRTNVRVVRLAWNGDGWTGPTTPIELNPSITAVNFIGARYDGNQFLTVIPSQAPNTDQCTVYERNKANSLTVTRQTPSHPQGAIRACSVNYNTVTRDIRVYAVGTTINDLYYVDYVRATDTWVSWAAVTATDVLGGTIEWGTRRGTQTTAKHHVYVAHSGAPNTVVEYQQSLTYAPLTPTWEYDAVTWRNGGAADINAGLFLDWSFNAVNPADVQTAYAVSRQIGAGALAYWRASDSTWQVAEVKNVTGSTSFTVAAPWGADADANHTYKVKTWNAADVASSYSDPLVLTPSVKVNPTITLPVDGVNQTTDTVTVTWTPTAGQTAWRVETLIFGFMLQDSGKVMGGAGSYVSPERLGNGFSYSVRLRTWNAEGLESDTDTNSFPVVFVEPATPSLVATPSPANGWTAVVITNPAPTGGQPAVLDQEVWHRLVGDVSAGTRIASGVANNGTVNDWRVWSGKAYEWRVKVNGVNGASTFGPWTA